MMRRCSHCNNNGHNSRTCPNRGVRLFGVRLTDGPIRKSASMGNLTHYAGSTGGASPADGHDHGGPAGPGGDGYASEDFAQGHSSSCRERKKGVSWTEEEHRMFLVGLQKLGKGDWRGIARNYVVSRTPTQVASHAQKYFIRQTNASRRKRRTSLFDMVPDEPLDPQLSSMSHQEPETQGSCPLPLPALPALDEDRAPMDSTTDVAGAVPNSETAQYNYPVIVPAFFPPFFPCPVQFWPGYCAAGVVEKKAHEIVKPMAMHPKAPIMIDDLRGMSQLSLGEPGRDTRPPFLSPKLPDGSDRQSAFHSSTAPSNRSISAV